MQTQVSTHGARGLLKVGISGANAAVAVTIDASPADRWVIDYVEASFSTVPAAATTLTIAVTQNGTAVTFTTNCIVSSSVFRQWLFQDQILWSDLNTAVVVTLNAGGAAVIGYLNVIYH